jgi:hypothetical protein
METGTETGPSPEAGSGRPRGGYVDTNELGAVLDATRVRRLALNVLYDSLPGDLMRGPVEDALATLHDRLTQDETRALTQCGFAEHYVVIRPFSPLSLPEPQAVTEITSAIRTLERHGMLVQAPDARERDDEC